MTESDKDIYDRVCAAGARLAVDQLTHEIRRGDAEGRKLAERWVRDYCSARELVAIKRWIKR